VRSNISFKTDGCAAACFRAKRRGAVDVVDDRDERAPWELPLRSGPTGVLHASSAGKSGSPGVWLHFLPEAWCGLRLGPCWPAVGVCKRVDGSGQLSAGFKQRPVCSVQPVRRSRRCGLRTPWRALRRG